jgi:hypothetical protein
VLPKQLPKPVITAGSKKYYRPGALNEIEEAGRWYFKRDILDRIDRHHVVMRAIRAFNEGHYQMAVKVGAILAPAAFGTSLHGFNERDALIEETGRMGFACVAFRKNVREYLKGDADTYAYAPELAILSKYDRAKGVIENYHGEVYGFTIVYEFDGFPYVAGEIPIAILPNGLMILREYRPIHQRLPKTRGDGMSRGGKHGDIVCHGAWRWSAHLAYIAREWKVEITEVMERTLVLFQQVYALAYAANSDTRVAVTKDHITTAFAVDLMRLPYFFADRDKGNAKRRPNIFHIVRPHERAGSSIVHAHFRGARTFVWNGYEVRITMPGKHHPALSAWNAAGMEADDFKPGERGISMPALARLLSLEFRA